MENRKNSFASRRRSTFRATQGVEAVVSPHFLVHSENTFTVSFEIEIAVTADSELLDFAHNSLCAYYCFGAVPEDYNPDDDKFATEHCVVKQLEQFLQADSEASSRALCQFASRTTFSQSGELFGGRAILSTAEGKNRTLIGQSTVTARLRPRYVCVLAVLVTRDSTQWDRLGISSSTVLASKFLKLTLEQCHIQEGSPPLDPSPIAPFTWFPEIPARARVSLADRTCKEGKPMLAAGLHSSGPAVALPANWSPLKRSKFDVLRSREQVCQLAQQFHKYLMGVVVRKVCPLKAAKLTLPFYIPDGMYSPQCSNFIMFLEDCHRVVDIHRAKEQSCGDTPNQTLRLPSFEITVNSESDVAAGSPMAVARKKASNSARFGFVPFQALKPDAVIDMLLMLCADRDLTLSSQGVGVEVRKSKKFMKVCQGPWTVDWFDFMLLATVESDRWPTLVKLIEAYDSFVPPTLPRPSSLGEEKQSKAEAFAILKGNRVVRYRNFDDVARHIKHVARSLPGFNDMMEKRVDAFLRLDALEASTPEDSSKLDGLERATRSGASHTSGFSKPAQLWKTICSRNSDKSKVLLGHPEDIMVSPARVIWALFPMQTQRLLVSYINGNLPILVTKKRAAQNLKNLGLALQLEEQSVLIVLKKYYGRLAFNARERRQFQRRKAFLANSFERRFSSCLQQRYFNKWQRFIAVCRAVHAQKQVLDKLRFITGQEVMLRYFDKLSDWPLTKKMIFLQKKSHIILRRKYFRTLLAFRGDSIRRKLAENLCASNNVVFVAGKFLLWVRLIRSRQLHRKQVAADVLCSKIRHVHLESRYQLWVSRVLPVVKKRRRALRYEVNVQLIERNAVENLQSMRMGKLERFVKRRKRFDAIALELSKIVGSVRAQVLRRFFAKLQRYIPIAGQCKAEQAEKIRRVSALRKQNLHSLLKYYFREKWRKWYYRRFVERHRYNMVNNLLKRNQQQFIRSIFIRWRRDTQKRLASVPRAQALALMLADNNKRLQLLYFARWCRASPRLVTRQERKQRSRAAAESLLWQRTFPYVTASFFRRWKAWVPGSKQRRFQKAVSDTILVSNKCRCLIGYFAVWKHFVESKVDEKRGQRLLHIFAHQRETLVNDEQHKRGGVASEEESSRAELFFSMQRGAVASAEKKERANVEQLASSESKLAAEVIDAAVQRWKIEIDAWNTAVSLWQEVVLIYMENIEEPCGRSAVEVEQAQGIDTIRNLFVNQSNDLLRKTREQEQEQQALLEAQAKQQTQHEAEQEAREEVIVGHEEQQEAVNTEKVEQSEKSEVQPTKEEATKGRQETQQNDRSDKKETQKEAEEKVVVKQRGSTREATQQQQQQVGVSPVSESLGNKDKASEKSRAAGNESIAREQQEWQELQMKMTIALEEQERAERIEIKNDEGQSLALLKEGKFQVKQHQLFLHEYSSISFAEKSSEFAHSIAAVEKQKKLEQYFLDNILQLDAREKVERREIGLEEREVFVELRTQKKEEESDLFKKRRRPSSEESDEFVSRGALPPCLFPATGEMELATSAPLLLEEVESLQAQTSALLCKSAELEQSKFKSEELRYREKMEGEEKRNRDLAKMMERAHYRELILTNKLKREMTKVPELSMNFEDDTFRQLEAERALRIRAEIAANSRDQELAVLRRLVSDVRHGSEMRHSQSLSFGAAQSTRPQLQSLAESRMDEALVLRERARSKRGDSCAEVSQERQLVIPPPAAVATPKGRDTSHTNSSIHRWIDEQEEEDPNAAELPPLMVSDNSSVHDHEELFDVVKSQRSANMTAALPTNLMMKLVPLFEQAAFSLLERSFMKWFRFRHFVKQRARLIGDTYRKAMKVYRLTRKAYFEKWVWFVTLKRQKNSSIAGCKMLQKKNEANYMKFVFRRWIMCFFRQLRRKRAAFTAAHVLIQLTTHVYVVYFSKWLQWHCDNKGVLIEDFMRRRASRLSVPFADEPAEQLMRNSSFASSATAGERNVEARRRIEASEKTKVTVTDVQSFFEKTMTKKERQRRESK